MRILIAIFLALTPATLIAQDQDVLDKLKAYDFETAFLSTTLKDADAEHAFSLQTTIMSLDDTTLEQIEFDPRRPIGERWKLLTVNGEEPTEDDLHEFDHTHNTKDKEVNAEVDDSSLRIESEDQNYLVVGFRYKKESLPRKVKFLHQCEGLAYIKKDTKKLERAEFINQEQLRVRTMRVNILDMKVKFDFLPEEDIYHISRETLWMGTYYHGMIYDINIENIYSDFQKVK